ncbi:MAG: RNA 2'-phosphotransferase [Alphaproteobacteria bacterium]|nr:RNA 2'-phosphotransferase [Alphaproteobacteria bacterium]
MSPKPLDLTRVSRTVSHALRHEPWLYELELDDQGWTDVEALLAALHQEQRAWANLGAQDLTAMIESSSKRRYELIGGKIRALYGHSIPDRLLKMPAAPPQRLFHGTAPEVVPDIRQHGLLPMGRQYVHLSVNRDEAVAVGKRKAPVPVILSVRAHDAWKDGVAFYSGNERVWLADRVPWAYIETDARREM